MEVEQLTWDGAVAWQPVTRDAVTSDVWAPELGLVAGHPGRVRDTDPQFLTVEWYGLEAAEPSRNLFELEDLEAITEDDFRDRVERMERGLGPRSLGS